MADGPSTYLRHLPEIFRAPRPDGSAPFLGEFLKIFEALLAGREDAHDIGIEGVEDVIDRFPEAIDAALAPVDRPLPALGEALTSELLDYLASWAALALDQNWNLEKKREWTRRIIPLYQRRGTRGGLQDYLNTFVGDNVGVSEPPGGFILAMPGSTTLGVDTFLAGGSAYFFRVGINYAFGEPFTLTGWINIQRGTRAIIDLEKPAHTYYRLDARTRGFWLAQPGYTVLGRETLIWQNSTPLEL
jgi:phage tail-like protein